MDVGCYNVSGSRLLGGEPTRVWGEAWYGPSGTDWVFTGTMRFPGDVIATFDCGTAMTDRDELEAIGSEGSLFLDDPWHCASPAIELRREDGVERIEIDREDSYRLELENLSDAIRGEAPLLLGREDALGQARALEALHASATIGRSGLALAGRVDRGQREPLVLLARQPADADGADADVPLEDGDAAEEEREERVEARPLDRVVADLLGQLPRRPRIAAGCGVGLPLRVQAGVGRGAVHRRGRHELAVGVGDEDGERSRRRGDDVLDDAAGALELHCAILTYFPSPLGWCGQ